MKHKNTFFNLSLVFTFLFSFIFFFHSKSHSEGKAILSSADSSPKNSRANSGSQEILLQKELLNLAKKYSCSFEERALKKDTQEKFPFSNFTICQNIGFYVRAFLIPKNCALSMYNYRVDPKSNSSDLTLSELHLGPQATSPHTNSSATITFKDKTFVLVGVNDSIKSNQSNTTNSDENIKKCKNLPAGLYEIENASTCQKVSSPQRVGNYLIELADQEFRILKAPGQDNGTALRSTEVQSAVSQVLTRIRIQNGDLSVYSNIGSNSPIYSILGNPLVDIPSNAQEHSQAFKFNPKFLKEIVSLKLEKVLGNDNPDNQSPHTSNAEASSGPENQVINEIKNLSKFFGLNKQIQLNSTRTSLICGFNPDKSNHRARAAAPSGGSSTR